MATQIIGGTSERYPDHGFMAFSPPLASNRLTVVQQALGITQMPAKFTDSHEFRFILQEEFVVEDIAAMTRLAAEALRAAGEEVEVLDEHFAVQAIDSLFKQRATSQS